MINTVHEDDFAAWYRVPETVGEISISDFEFDDEDFLPEDFQGVPMESAAELQLAV